MRAFLAWLFPRYWFDDVMRHDAVDRIVALSDPAWEQAKADSKAKHDRAQTPRQTARVSQFRRIVGSVEPIPTDWHADEHFQGEHRR